MTQNIMLTPDEFCDALAKGLGRAVRHVREVSADMVRNMLLEACLRCKTYDTQCEGYRTSWLFNMVELTGESDYYREKILEAIPASRDTDDYNFWQLFYLIKEYAIRGDEECRTALYREFDLMVDDNNIGGADAIIEIDGLTGLLHVLEIAGLRIRNGGDIWWEVSYQIEKSEEKFGKDVVHNAIEAEALRNEFVRTYCEEKENVCTRDDFGISVIDNQMAEVISRTPPQNEEKTAKRPISEWIAGILSDDFDDDDIRSTTEDNIVARLCLRHRFLSSRGRGRVFDDEEVEAVWSVLISEENPYRLFCLLNPFGSVKRLRLPRFDPKFLAWIDAPRPLSGKAAQVLAKMSDELIRLKALELLQTVPPKQNWYDGFELILSSFQPEDEKTITTALQTHHLPHVGCLHNVGMDIIKLAETWPNVTFREPLLWFYDRTPCSLCRLRIVEELDKRQLVPKEIWKECVDDCDDQLRELALERNHE
jgi:hypothetical protein